MARWYTARRAHPDTPAEARKLWPRPRFDWLGKWVPDRVPDRVLLVVPFVVIPVGLVCGALLRWWLYQS